MSGQDLSIGVVCHICDKGVCCDRNWNDRLNILVEVEGNVHGLCTTKTGCVLPNLQKSNIILSI